MMADKLYVAIDQHECASIRFIARDLIDVSPKTLLYGAATRFLLETSASLVCITQDYDPENGDYSVTVVYQILSIDRGIKGRVYAWVEKFLEEQRMLP